MPTIEDNIGRIADALEAIAKLAANPITTSITNTITAPDPKAAEVAAAAVKAAAGKEKPKDTKPEVKVDPVVEAPAAVEVDPLDEPPAKPPTLDEVRAALKTYRDVEGAAAMMDILKQNGADTLGELKADKYASVLAAVK